ncbi:hypothetical protein [Calothrix sp. NIES-3974]|uniref:hypothetical protein n=1 Tax=Calothrix sp. NIES-3974 TaxID=2005462 RepID=UPI000B61E8C4|nr:hypothetical protein [Calothrix sp. NIES-3974]BAZ03968.1 hypothetical protein NIES3974_05980 [Calothrix sp. NIES-3974]
MLRRFILVSGLIAATALGFAGRASAQVSETFEARFSGGINDACTLGDPATTTGETASGTLTYDTANRRFTGSLANPIAINCSGGTLEASVTEGTNPTPAESVVATVSDGTNTATANLTTSDEFTVANSATGLTVGLEVTFPADPAPAPTSGAYTYVVTLTGTSAQ